MKKAAIAAVCAALISTAAEAGEWTFEAMGKARTLFGYGHPDSRYSYHRSRYHLPTRFNLSLLAQYSFDDSYQLGAYLDLAYGFDQQLKDYNHGSWGEEAYLILDAPFGRVVGGQSYNAAYQLGVGAPDAGVLGVNQSDLVNFVANPNWQRNRRGTAYRTLNSTDINTDGTAPKITYISPEFDGTMFGLTFVPESFSRDGLISRYAPYHDKAGYIASVYHNRELGNVNLSASLAAAHFEDIDDELSAGLSLYYKGWTFGGGVRRTFVSHKYADMNVRSPRRPEGFDAYRDAWAANIGVGYEIGPVKTALTYFYSKADGRDYEDKIVQLSGRYQLNRHFELQAAVARDEFKGYDAAESNEGYAFVTGIGFKF